jgi:hypothetical protein
MAKLPTLDLRENKSKSLKYASELIEEAGRGVKTTHVSNQRLCQGAPSFFAKIKRYEFEVL